ncbi:ribosomal RNA-processing protein 8 [Sebastes umbrosus]|uniref:ribosomal RNA-processing protein 8 n=1 Tax=Sebastes umbrosus TaxID=72105 RepID=UPI0018A02D3B|nr:ribosomal RNA-processing protein 8 [Sebastes umbrosus]
MFNEEEDWSDEQDAQVLNKPVLSDSQKKNSSTNVKSKVVGKKSLLRTLQALGSVPEWKNDDHQQDSDSEAEVVPSHSKKKKKRRKRQKQAETTGEQQENGDFDQTVNDEKPETKKRKKDNTSGALKVKNPSVGETKDEEMTKSAEVNINEPEDTERRSRQQWKNKMKNKRNCKNKYSQKKPEEEVNKAQSAEQRKPKEEVKTDPYSSNNNNNSQTPAKKKEKQCKPQKRKKTEEDTDISGTTESQMLRDQKKQIGGKIEKGTTESCADGSKQKADAPEVEITDDQHQSAMKRLKPELSREQILKRERLRKMLTRQEPVQQESPAETKEEPAVPEEEVKQDRSASLRSRMEQRLESARFRYINEVLYSTSSGEAKRMFKQDPQAFGIYHRGYTTQVQRWPSNPVDAIISYIRQKPPSLVVADFGCGDCKIALSVKNKVHSFDLAAACDLVTVCDMANVPLRDGSVDIAVFCLSLMGTNLADFLVEANRVLKRGGVLKIAEVASRFENVRNFSTALASLGFKMVSKDTENTHFYSFELLKTGEAPENIKKFGLQLRPCVYKKR